MYLAKKIIQVNLIFYLLPVFLNEKLKEKISLYFNYRKLNTIIKKNCYLIPFIKEILAQLKIGKYFIKIVIYQAFYKIKIFKYLKEIFFYKISSI